MWSTGGAGGDGGREVVEGERVAKCGLSHVS
jgi:hypothetical protein